MKTRVLHVFPYYLPPGAPNVAGVKTSLLNLIRGLASAGVDSSVLVPGANPDYDQDFLDAGAEAVTELGLTRHLVFERHAAGPAYLLRYPARLASESRALSRLLPSLGVDIVHSHGSAFVGACAAARRVGLPSVLHVHEDIVRLPPWAQGAYVRRAPRLADSLVCCADYLRDRFIAAGAPRETCVSVPNSVDTSRFRPDGSRPLRQELGLAEGDLLIGFVGRLVPGKDPTRFIEACRQVALRRPEARFAIVGGVDDQRHDAYVRQLHALAADPALAGRLTFTGSRPDMPEVMRSLDVLVMCSHNEAMPNSVLEAMASGVAVIDQSGGGGPEAIAYGGAGRLVQAPGAAALATAVSEVASDGHLRRSIAAAGRRRAEEVYSLAAMTKAMLPVYEGLLEGRAEDRESR